MKDYPFVKCLHPRRIVNPYTKEELVVPCGRCEACQTSKALRYKLQCDLERKCHKFCVFVTLTYAPEFLPCCYPVLSDLESHFEDDCAYDLVDDEGVVLTTTFMTRHQMDMLLSKFNIGGKIPYLRKRDLQLFLKRLRKRIFKKTNEKVRFFAAGEYGPVHFRPHYHVLLYFSSRETLSYAFDAVCASWKYGRVDVQLSVSDVSKYVSGYVNSFSRLPKIYKVDGLCPFNSHSQRLGQGYFSYLRETIYEKTLDEIITMRSVINDRYQEFGTLPSIIALYFPKCRGYSYKSPYNRTFLYKIYGLAKTYFPDCSNCMELATSVAHMLYISNLNQVHNGYNSLFARFLEVCSEGFPHGFSVDTLEFTGFIEKLYRLFSLSRHFLEFCCVGRSPDYVLQRIDSFYKDLDMRRLSEFYRTQSVFCDSDFADSDDYLYMYNNSLHPDTIKYTKIYSYYVCDVDTNYNNQIKHKKLNDLNKIYCYD